MQHGQKMRVNCSGLGFSISSCSHATTAAWCLALRWPRDLPALPPCAGSVPAARRAASVVGPVTANEVPCSSRISGRQSSQYFRFGSDRITPHSWQAAGTFRAGAVARGGRVRTLAHPALRFASVSGVGAACGDTPRSVSGIRAIPSATGPMGAAHCGAVSASVRVTGGIRRHAPCRVSKKSPAPNGRDRTSSST